MDLSHYSVKDFVLNESFQKWTLEPDLQGKIFWEDWMKEHPDKIELITEARSTIETIREIHETDLSGEYDEVWQRITEDIGDLGR